MENVKSKIMFVIKINTLSSSAFRGIENEKEGIDRFSCTVTLVCRRFGKIKVYLRIKV